jgi:hypothetical protein
VTLFINNFGRSIKFARPAEARRPGNRFATMRVTGRWCGFGVSEANRGRRIHSYTNSSLARGRSTRAHLGGAIHIPLPVRSFFLVPAFLVKKRNIGNEHPHISPCFQQRIEVHTSTLLNQCHLEDTIASRGLAASHARGDMLRCVRSIHPSYKPTLTSTFTIRRTYTYNNAFPLV